jgi:3-dehydroquinate dehydratase type I
MGLICVTLTEGDVESTVRLANTLNADIVEVRLDHMKDTQGLEGLAGVKSSLMVTCMPEWEGGLFRGGEGERMGLLKGALAHADYVSLELKTEKKLRDDLVMDAGKRGVKVIIAYHDFTSTPKRHDIVGILKREEEACADIAKVAFKPNNHSQVLDVLKAQVTANLRIPAIALSMGELGRVTRVVGPMLGGYLTFAAPTEERKAAEGQFTLSEMRQIRELLWR